MTQKFQARSSDMPLTLAFDGTKNVCSTICLFATRLITSPDPSRNGQDSQTQQLGRFILFLQLQHCVRGRHGQPVAQSIIFAIANDYYH